jgi:hypothetical protein
MNVSFAIVIVSLLGITGRALPSREPRPEVFGPGVISGPANDLSPAFTPDGRTVFFTRANAEQSIILVSHLSGEKWSKPEIAPFSGVWRDLEPAMAMDGSYLIFASNRPAIEGGTPLDAFYNGATQPKKGGNLWRVDRTTNGWGAPHRLPDVINGNSSVFSPALAANGSLYFMQPSGAKSHFHIFRSRLTHGEYEPPVAVSVSAGEDVGDFDPVVAPDESFMVFSSARLTDKGTSLFIAFQKNDGWSTPAYMDSVVSPPMTGNIEARLSPDHRTLYWSSTRVVPPQSNSDRAAAERSLREMEAWNNGLANVWSVALDHWIGAGPTR